MASCDDIFVHEPLDTTKYSTRIVRIHASPSETDGIECTLEHFDIETGKPYVCLSYCWGDAQPTHFISVNNQRLEVRHNLWKCLRRLRRQNVKDRLWIDAICIDQNNIAERGHQVRFMGDIYRMANHVLLYIGGRPWEKHLLAVIDSVQITSDKSPERKANSKAERTSERRTSVLPKDFLREPYWSRMWILQEVLLARVVYIVLSETKLDIRCVTCLADTNTPGGIVMSLREKQGLSRPFKPYDLDDLIMQTSNSKCKEPSDQVYALLGLVRDDIVSQFPVDYTRSKPEIAFDVIEHMQTSKRVPRTRSKREFRSLDLDASVLTVHRVMDVFATLSFRASVFCRKCAISSKHFTESSDVGQMLRSEKKFRFVWIQEDLNLSLTCSRPHLNDGTSYCTDSRASTRYLFCRCCIRDVLEGGDRHRLQVVRKSGNLMLARIARKPPQRGSRLLIEGPADPDTNEFSSDTDSEDEPYDSSQGAPKNQASPIYTSMNNQRDRKD